MIAYFKFYRRWRGGRWAKVTGWLWGKRWVRVTPECLERVDETYPDRVSRSSVSQVMTREQLRESNIRDLHDTIERARRQWNRENGNCTMCATGDRPVGGMHRGQWPCGNRTTCQACHGVLPKGEQCAVCNRIAQEGP